MPIIKKYLSKIEALSATGMPGAYKLIIFFALEQKFGLSTLGNIASWQSTAQILGFFTAIGWCSLILVRIPKAETNAEKIQAYNSLLLMGLATLTIFTAAAMLIGHLINEWQSALQIALWLAAWTLYQIPRHHLIAQRKYRAILIFDTTIIASSIICIFASTEHTASYSLAACMLATGIAASLLLQQRKTKNKLKANYELKGLEYGVINLLSGGITLSLIPLAHYLSGSEFAGSISLFLVIISIALLIPRAISTYQLPDLSKTINNTTDLKLRSQSMQRKISLSNLLTTVFNLICAAYISFQSSTTASNYLLFATLSLITLQNTIAIQGLVYSNILMAYEETKKTLKINILSSILFITSCLAALAAEGKYSFLAICIAIFLIYTLRLTQTKNLAIKQYDSNPVV